MGEFAEITALIADRATLFRHGSIGMLKRARPAGHPPRRARWRRLAHLRVEPVDLVLIDPQLGGGPTLASLRRLRQNFPDQQIVVLSDNDERAAILECLAAGANGYILKSTTLAQLLRAIETVLSGGVFAPAALAGTPPSAAKAADTEMSPLLAHLTDRQIEVFQLLSEGCATKTIARRLGLAVGTVKVHLAAIYRVLGAQTASRRLPRPVLGTCRRCSFPMAWRWWSEFSG